MATNDLATVKVRYTLSGVSDEVFNDFGFKALDSGASRAGLAAAFKTALVKATSGGLLYNTVSGYQSADLTVVDVIPGTGATYGYSYAAVTGTSGGDAMPLHDCAVITWTSDIKGRSHRGRSFLTGYGEGDQSKGIWTSTVQTVLAAIGTQMLAVFGPTGSDTHWQFGVISRVEGGSPRPVPIWTAVTGVVVRDIVFTQRRRTVGRGQ
jgi:hypothetical protein